MIYDDGWVLVRPSGTEPKFRIYSESKIKEVAVKRADDTERIATEYMRTISGRTHSN
jgi:phosphomannomutase/phosphoglucomutase